MFSSALRVLAITQLIRAAFLPLRNAHRHGDESGVSLPETAKEAMAQQRAHLMQMTKSALYVPAGGAPGWESKQRLQPDRYRRTLRRAAVLVFIFYLSLGLKDGGVQLTG